MIQTVEAVIDEEGNVRLLEPLHLPSARRALVTILEERHLSTVQEYDAACHKSQGATWRHAYRFRRL